MRRALLTVTCLTVSCLALLGGALSAQTSAQTPAQSTAPSAPTKFRFVLSVVDETGTTVEDIASPDVDVRVGNERATVNSVTRYHEAPIRVVIVLDESGSMAEFWTPAVALVVELLQSLPPNSVVGIITGNEKPNQGELLTKPESILNYLRNRSRPHRGPHGETRLWDHIHEALAMLGTPRATDMVFVVSDGADNSSHVSQKRLLQEVRATGVRVSGAIFFVRYASTREEASGFEGLAELVDSTGGRNFGWPFVHGKSASFRFEEVSTSKEPISGAGFFRTFFNFYMVEVTTAQPLKKPTKLKVRVNDARGQQRKGLLLAAPEQLSPAGP